MPFTPEEGMRLPTVLSALALILAVMQGVLSLESTAPARISLLKAHLLLGLEFVELSIVFFSEVLTFVGLQRALTERMTWLAWLAPALLVLGVCELVIDGFTTFRAVTFSRTLWVPLSMLGQSSGCAQTAELICILLTGALSFVLVGWRQAAWWRSTYVARHVAEAAAQSEPSLRTTPVVISIAIALAIVAIPTVFCLGYSAYALLATVFGRFSSKRARYSKYTGLWTMRHPKVWKRPRRGPITPRMRDQYRLLAEIQKNDSVHITDDEVDIALGRSPLHLGNTLIGPDCNIVSDRNIVRDVRSQHFIITILKQVAVMPFLIIVVAALFRMRNLMDKETYAVFEELADAATVVVLQEFAVALKTYIWRLRGVSRDIRADTEMDILIYRAD